MNLKYYDIRIIITFLDQANINFNYLCAVNCVTITTVYDFKTLEYIQVKYAFFYKQLYFYIIFLRLFVLNSLRNENLISAKILMYTHFEKLVKALNKLKRCLFIFLEKQK